MKTIHKKRLLIIDDDRLFCDAAREFLSRLPLDILMANSGKDGLSICSEKHIDIVLLDQKLPDTRGTDLYQSILAKNDATKIIFITAYPDLKRAVQALKQGVHDYIPKPFEPDELELVVQKTIKTIDLERMARLHHYTTSKNRSDDTVLVGAGPEMARLRELIERASASQAPVLITGETGTGKNMVARAIHYGGPDKDAPFVTVNCAAIPENLIESELFGAEKGAFTGAVQSSKGLFELAQGGTLFLDEIGEMPPATQSKLLGVLDEKKFRKIGGQQMIEADVRIIAATNINVEEALARKTFRSDVYFRLNIIPIHIPPLKERAEDIPLLVQHFITRFSGKSPVRISDDEMAVLNAYPFPGNIRELGNIIERSVILRTSDVIHPSSLIDPPAALSDMPRNPAGPPFVPETLKDLEEDHIRKTLAHTRRNYTHAAKHLGISRSTLMRKIETYGL